MSYLRRWISWRSLRTRISVALVGLTLALGIVALIYATLNLTKILEERLESRGTAIARDLAARAATPSQVNDVFGLYQVVNDSLLSNEDVRYIFLVEPAGGIRVHTFEGGVPDGLADANHWDPLDRQSVRLLSTNEGSMLDVAVPVLEGQGGVVRVGMSLAGVRKQVVNHLRNLSLLVGAATLVAIALSYALSSLLTRPLARVGDAAKRVGAGDLDTKLPVHAGDELGELAQAFNTMTEDLLRSRESLVQRNTELEILNSMAGTLSQQLGRSHALHTSLDRLMGLTKLSAAWVCLRDSGGQMRLASYRGPAHPDHEGLNSHSENGCACLSVFETLRTSGVYSPPSCPLVVNGNQNGQEIRSHAVVPLWSGDRLVGALGVASSDMTEFDEARVRLLTSVGQQMGIALENATLYEELERKERIRAQLLRKVIVAQEEERKRIAREIHDEPTQALSGVILQLDEVERKLAGQEDVYRVRQGVRTAMESLHRITAELRPHVLDDLGFVPAIRWYAQQRLGDQGVDVDLNVAGRPYRLPPQAEIAVFRITQEAINNVAKHAEADSVRIRLGFGDAVISGEVEDDGKGFEPDAAGVTSADGAGLGLMGMRERAVLLDGSLAVESSLGRGTRVIYEIPVKESPPVNGA